MSNWEIEFVEKGAALEHARWSKWQKYMFAQCLQNADGSLVIPSHLVKRWTEQAATPYVQLSEKEKDSDREQTREYLSLVRALVEN